MNRVQALNKVNTVSSGIKLCAVVNKVQEVNRVHELNRMQEIFRVQEVNKMQEVNAVQALSYCAISEQSAVPVGEQWARSEQSAGIKLKLNKVKEVNTVQTLNKVQEVKGSTGIPNLNWPIFLDLDLHSDGGCNGCRCKGTHVGKPVALDNAG